MVRSSFRRRWCRKLSRSRSRVWRLRSTSRRPNRLFRARNSGTELLDSNFRNYFRNKKGRFKKAFRDRNRAPNRAVAFWNGRNGANEDGDILTVPKARSTQIAAPNFRTARSTNFSLVCIFRWTIFDEAKCKIAKISILAKQNYALSFFEALFFHSNL